MFSPLPSAPSNSSLQHLIASCHLPLYDPAIIQIMNDGISQGVDIQLKILQTLLFVITNFPTINGRQLANVRAFVMLHKSRTALVSSTVTATPRQLVMFVVDKVVQDHRLLLANELESITLPDMMTQAFRPAACDASLSSRTSTFALELIESVLTNYHQCVSLPLYPYESPLIRIATPLGHLFPPLTPQNAVRAIRLPACPPRHLNCHPPAQATVLQASSRRRQAETILTLLIKLIHDETDTGEPRWMRVLAMEIMLCSDLCSDAEFMRSVWQRFDALATDSDTRSASSARAVVAPSPSSYPPALKHLVTSRPALFRVSAQIHHSSGSVAEMVVTAVSTTVSNVVGMADTEAGLSVQTAAMKVQCVDQLDKADASLIPDGCIYLLGVQFPVSLSDILAGYTFSTTSSWPKSHPRVQPSPYMHRAHSTLLRCPKLTQPRLGHELCP
ncbi:hypothetical protein BGY98DRAFT_1189635 [Russula aff. rugulosa BPL654]|nr:hypothetical protein BGY98DRAFT_1189635 [Russula aff. rugulosa BPL654]